ncbi:MAG: TipAS antibiotic-recognition domain-containing protein, partial [Chloroflexales bacterium]|nr:TipAS antibiotic-recognition domain-containing protein [Chloroflexales bacterium]
ALEEAREVDWLEVIAIIRSLREADRREWLSRYFPPEQWRWLRERAAQAPTELIEQGTRAWQELHEAFRQRQHLPPAHPEVQQLAARMHQLSSMFTRNDAAVEQGLAALYKDVSQIPAAYRLSDDQSLHDYMFQALTIYREQGAQP